jgi:colicin import membrane protein
MGLRFDWSEPGVWISSVGHVAMLVAGLVVFSGTATFEPSEEAIAVEIVTDSAISQVTRGEKTAPAVLPTPRPRAERVAEKVELKEAGEAKADTAAAPTRTADMKVDDKPVEAAAPSPPPRPVARPEQVKPDPKPDVPRQDLAKLVEQGELEAKAKAEAAAKAKAKAEADAKAAKAEADAKAKAVADAKAKADARAKAIATAKQEAEAKAKREAEIANKFSATDISRLLKSKEKAQSSGATAQEINKTASLGTQTGTASKLNPSLRGQLVGLLRDQMERCYAPPIGASAGAGTAPVLDIRLNPDGSLSTEPRILRAGAGTTDRAVADAALRAVRRCAPYRVPTQFAPYFNDWKTLNVEFELPTT